MKVVHDITKIQNNLIGKIVFYSYCYFYRTGQLASGCSPPEPVEGLVQFINAVDVVKRTEVTYQPGTIVTAQCREPGVKELRGNTNARHANNVEHGVANHLLVQVRGDNYLSVELYWIFFFFM